MPEPKLDDLVERLGRAAARRTAFETAIAGGGAFPNVGRAKVLWTGLDLDEPGRTELDRLATGCRAAANRAGVEVDGARFRPHLTVGRTKFPHDVSSLGPAAGLLHRPAVAGGRADPRRVLPRRGASAAGPGMWRSGFPLS